MECAWCAKRFEPTTSYQIYCNAQCRKDATRAKIKERSSIAAIKRRAKKKRFCVNGCGTLLSIYNSGKVCQRCKTNDKLVNKALDGIKELFDYEQQ